jgi:hypothetical protein
MSNFALLEGGGRERERERDSREIQGRRYQPIDSCIMLRYVVFRSVGESLCVFVDEGQYKVVAASKEQRTKPKSSTKTKGAESRTSTQQELL